ncbi:MAG: hypothetical protein N3C60_02280 [Calditerrivibrio sp.]|nr:hypothetical protein [Calditerrivibrio sp.]
MDNRPYTAVLQHDLGIGDLIFRLPYIEAVAKKSKNGKVVLIARPTCRPHDILRGVDYVEEIIIYDRWRKEDNKGEHRGLKGFFKLLKIIKLRQFDRIVIFSDRIRYGMLAFLAGIPVRIGYGGFKYNWLQRFFLNRKPYIKEYKGPCISNYEWATELAILHGFAKERLVPRLMIPLELLEKNRDLLSGLPDKRVVLAVGASVKHKDWGIEKFSELSLKLLMSGVGVVCVGGKAEESILNDIRQRIPESFADRFRVFMPNSVMDSAAIIKHTNGCIGNDTGILYVAAATGSATLVLIGNRPVPCHDPDIRYITAASVQDIAVDEVYHKIILQMIT